MTLMKTKMVLQWIWVLHFLPGHLFQTASNNQSMTFYRGLYGNYYIQIQLSRLQVIQWLEHCPQLRVSVKRKGRENCRDTWVRLCLILAPHEDRNWSQCSTTRAPNSFVRTPLKNIIKHFAEQRFCSHTLLNEGFWWTSKHRKKMNKLKIEEGY